MTDPEPGEHNDNQVWQRWDEVDRLFDAALDVAPHEREQFLQGASAGDAELMRSVLRLLEIADAREHWLDAPPPALLRAAWEREPPDGEGGPLGRVIGRYRITGELGRGGMATVFEAERADGTFEQRVAIKILRRGLDTDEVVRRFVAERQFLSELEHPRIGRLIDGGTTDDGRPFLVMERVTGEPITRWADRRRLSVRQRLELFLQVVDAVHFAHRRLIVHRDIKPSNILVDEAGNAKLLDFGIAKLLEPAETSLTRTGVRPLTPAFASPEQLRGERVTTASDVYQLGVLLYLLLSGRRPFPGHGAELEAAITTGRMRRPSDAIAAEPGPTVPEADCAAEETTTEIAIARRTTPDALRRALRGDLDAIILKAVRTEPERRYQSAVALAEDIERFLARMPILARPDTWAYRARRFATRQPAVSTSVAAAIVVAGVYVATLIRHAGRLELERDRARTESSKAQQVSAFVVSLFQTNDPDVAGGEPPTVFDVLQRGEREARQLADQPEVQAQMLDVIAQMYVQLGRYDSAEPLFRAALDQRRTLYPEPHVDLAGSLDRLGDLLQRTGRYDEAEPMLLESIEVARLAGDAALESDAYTDLGHSLVAHGEYVAAEDAYQRALEIRRRIFGESHERTATSLHNLALALEEQERFEPAESLYVRSLEIKRERLDADHSDISLTLTTLARLYSKQGRLDAAEPLLVEALESSRRRFGASHIRLALTLNELGTIAARRRDHAAAEVYFRESLAINETALGPMHSQVAVALNNVSYVLIEEGRLEDALPLRQRALEIGRVALGLAHQSTGLFAHNLALLLDRLGHESEAEARYRESIEILERALPDGHVLTSRPLAGLGDLLTQRGRPAEAEPLLRTALARRVTAGEPPTAVAEVESMLGAALAALGRRQEARALLEASLATLEREIGPDARLTREARERLAAVTGS